MDINKNWYSFVINRRTAMTIPKTLQEVAKRLVGEVWKRYSLGPDEKYSDYQVGLIIDNEPDLHELAYSLGGDQYDAVMSAVSSELKRREDIVFIRRRKKLNPSDPVHHLKQLIRGKDWESAKRLLLLNSPAGRTERGAIPDELAESAFQSQWRAAYNSTYSNYDWLLSRSPYRDENKGRIEKRLSEINTSINVPEDADPYIRAESLFFQRFFGHYRSEKMPDKITVFRGVPRADTKIRPGDYVTLDRNYARTYLRGKFGAIVSEVVPTDDLVVTQLDLDRNEFIYWPRNTPSVSNQPTSSMTFYQFWKQVNEF